MWDFIHPSDLPAASTTPGELAHGTCVSRHGTVSFTRSGFARVRWDDGRTSDEWCADLTVEDDHA